MPAVYYGDMSKGKFAWGAINLKDALPAEVQSFLDAFVLVNQGAKAAYAYQKASAILADAELIANSAIAQMLVMKSIVNTVVDIVASLFDTGFFELLIPPKKGGLAKFCNTVAAHTVDRDDPNRPTDDGGAIFMSAMFMISAKDIEEANRRIDGLSALWDKTKKDALVIKSFIERTVQEQEEILRRREADKKDFFKHYYRKRIIGSHAEQSLEDGWNKQTLADLMPKDFILKFQKWLSAWEDSYEFDLELYKLSGAIDAFWQNILTFVEDLQVILDTYIRLFTDTQLTIIVSPPLVGEAIVAGQQKPFNQKIFDKLTPKINVYSGKKSATQVYVEFLHELPSAIQQSAKDLTVSGYSLGLEKNTAEDLFGDPGVTGFPNVSDTQLTYDPVSRSLTLAVVTGVEKFQYYVAGQRYEAVSVAVSVPTVLKDSRFFVWYDNKGTIQLTDTMPQGAKIAELKVSADGTSVSVEDQRVAVREVSTQEQLHIEQNFTEFLRSDYCVGGFVFLFKAASYSLLQQQVNSFLKMFGLNVEWPAATDKFPS